MLGFGPTRRLNEEEKKEQESKDTWPSSDSKFEEALWQQIQPFKTHEIFQFKETLFPT
jgi:hypothetical protein